MKNIVWFDEVGKEDIPIVGGKGANLGEMLHAGIPVPYGFIVTAQTYFNFIKETGLNKKIKHLLGSLDHTDPKNLQETAENVQKLIMSERIPQELAKEIMLAYLDLPLKAKKRQKTLEKLSSLLRYPFVAVRSSATAEDLPDASFAGQQATFLNVSGEANVVKKVQEAWASLFTPRAIFYREENKFPHLKVGIAVPIQLMVTSEASGVMFTVDPVTNDKHSIIIEAILGLGELIVQGAVTPDHFAVDKKTLEIVSKKIATQTKILRKRNGENRETNLSKNLGSKQKISDKQVKEIARIGKLLEKHYYFPQDVEWAIEKERIFIVQTRPITTIKEKAKKSETAKKIDLQASAEHPVVLRGDPASPGIVWGPVKIIFNTNEIDKVLPGDILVTMQTNPDFVPAMKRAVAIVTERGGRTSHAAIVSRELGIPAIVGTADATKKLSDGMMITVNGSKGEIYKGTFAELKDQVTRTQMAVKKTSLKLKTATKVYSNMASPTRAAEVAKMNFDGVGLLRAEFMIADIGTHPKKLIKEHKEKVFIDKLASDLVKFCESFNPRPVVYRATDFKTNEYRNLIGGAEFEPEESNPMLGYRGAYRYMSDPKVFELELETIKLVRHEYGYKNLWLMLPFVRTLRELEEVKKIIAKNGLLRSPTFKLWLMVEIPSNVILLDKFCEIGIDGVSIGSNDLTMLILGTDRDNAEVAPEFNERDPAVLWALERVIKTCHKYKITSSICGQAPSDYPDLVEKLIKWGITSVSVNPDAVDHVRETIYNIEQKLSQKK
jgi:pyruvate,water dikinase